MRAPPSTRQKVSFFIFLAGLLVLGLFLAPCLTAPHAASAPPPTPPDRRPRRRLQGRLSAVHR
jgi:hypothetical protein